jgi:hypothetical protein
LAEKCDVFDEIRGPEKSVKNVVGVGIQREVPVASATPQA